MIKRMTLMLLALGVVFGGVFGFKYYIGLMIEEKLGNRQPPPATVTTTTAGRSTWQPTLHAVGSLSAARGVEVSAERAGQVTDLQFRSGAEVAEGELLVTQNTAPERAELDRLRARRDLAETQLGRVRKLARKDQASESDVDQAQAELEALKAQIRRQQAVIDQKRIQAPFAGVIGIREVDLGDQLQPGTPIASLQALSPLHVDFTLPQANLRDVREGQTVAFTVDAHPDTTFRAEVSAIEPKVSPDTRNFAVQATYDNADNRLRPGMYAEVDVQLPAKKGVITLPQTAISASPYGSTVYVVEEAKGDEEMATVSQRFVTTGDRRGDQVAITDGLEGGEEVVTAGQMKLEEGRRIRIDNSVQPSNDPDPQPANR
jgi:membrane fusion protein (multidrug efflux system)